MTAIIRHGEGGNGTVIRQRCRGGTAPGGTEKAELAGRRALVTGAGSGIGRAVALALARAGAAVAAADLRPDSAATVAEEIRAAGSTALPLSGDASSRDDARAWVTTTQEQLGGLEILVNNPAVANILRDGKTEQIATAIQSGSLQGMQSMDTALKRLLDAKQIIGKDAYRKAIDKKAFEMYAEPELAA